MPTKTKTLPKKRVNIEAPEGSADEQVEEAATLHPTMIAAVPDKSVADRYIGRKFDLGNGKTVDDMELFDYCYENGVNLLIEGPTGPGKTMATRAWAATRGKKVARIPSFSGIEGSQLFGKYNPDRVHGGFVWSDGPFTHVVRYGGVILWNEVNFTPERISTIAFGMLDDNREIVLLDKDGEIVRAHRGHKRCWCSLSKKECNEKRVIVVADMNPEYAGTREMNAAFRNRFGMQLAWDYDPHVEQQLVSSRTLRITAQEIRDDVAGYSTPVSTNMLMEFEQIAKDLSVTFAITNFVNHFKADERNAVKLVMDAKVNDLEKDYRPAPKVTEQPAAENVEVEGVLDEEGFYDFVYAEED